MHVPFIDLNPVISRISDGVMEDWKTTLDNGEFVGGPAVARLEARLAERFQVSNFIACANGTDALVVGLQAMGIKPGMRVAVPNMTFWAPYEAIVQVGAEPVLIDIDPDDLQMSYDEFRSAFEKFRFHGAILVHLFGWASPRLREFRRFCGERNVRLLEDGAQSFGVLSEGEPVYAGADVATISFYPAKVLGAAGDAGGIMTSNAKTAEMIRSLCNHGRAGHYTYDYVGWNSRMGGLNARYLNRMLDHIDEFIASRQKGERFYREYFTAHKNRLKVISAPEGQTGNGYLSVIKSLNKSGDELAHGLKDLKIGSARTYPQTLDQQPPARNALRASDLHHSQEFSRNVINLPLFAGITIEQCDAAAAALAKVSHS
jgi:dTDP-4-amino-4,6-dideoxygalactose transaminase